MVLQEEIHESFDEILETIDCYRTIDIIGLTLIVGGFVSKHFNQMALQSQEISPIMAMM